MPKTLLVQNSFLNIILVPRTNQFSVAQNVRRLVVVTIAVFPDLLDPQDCPERTENQAKMDVQANLECPADPPQIVNPQFLLHARNAHLVHLDPLDLKENLATLDQVVNLEVPDPTERQEVPAQPDPRAHLAVLDHKDPLEMPEPPLLQPLPPLATLAHKETPAHKELPDPLEALERTLNLALRDPPDPLANPVATDNPEPLELQDQRDPPDPKENAEFARNIAPWTAAFSSRTGPGDKKKEKKDKFYRQNFLFFLESPNEFFAIFFFFSPFAFFDGNFFRKNFSAFFPQIRF